MQLQPVGSWGHSSCCSGDGLSPEHGSSSPSSLRFRGAGRPGSVTDGYVDLGESHDLSEPPFPHLYDGNNRVSMRLPGDPTGVAPSPRRASMKSRPTIGSGSEVHGAIVPTEGQFTDSSGYLTLRVIR